MRTLSFLVAATMVLAAPLPSQAAHPGLAGKNVTVAVERASGRIAFGRAGTIEIYGRLSDPSPQAVLALGDDNASLIAFKGHAILLRSVGVGQLFDGKVAISDTGRELARWNVESPGFPSTGAELTEDGTGIVELRFVDKGLRKSVAIPATVPDGAYVVVTQRFSNGNRRVFALTALGARDARPELTTPLAVAALSPDEIVLTFGDGSVARMGVHSMTRQNVGGAPGGWEFADLDPGAGLALLRDRLSGVIVGCDLGRLAAVWRWDGAERRDEIEAFVAAARHGVGLKGRFAEASREIAEKDERNRLSGDARTKKAQSLIYGAEHALLLGNGRVLIVGARRGRGYEPWLGVLDTNALHLTGRELLSANDNARSNEIIASIGTGKYVASEQFRVLREGTLLVRLGDRWEEIRVSSEP